MQSTGERYQYFREAGIHTGDWRQSRFQGAAGEGRTSGLAIKPKVSMMMRVSLMRRSSRRSKTPKREQNAQLRERVRIDSVVWAQILHENIGSGDLSDFVNCAISNLRVSISWLLAPRDAIQPAWSRSRFGPRVSPLLPRLLRPQCESHPVLLWLEYAVGGIIVLPTHKEFCLFVEPRARSAGPAKSNVAELNRIAIRRLILCSFMA